MEFTTTSTEEQIQRLQQELAASQRQVQQSNAAARLALTRAEYAESERDGLINTLEDAFGQICAFKRENGMSDDDDITGRWFKQLLSTLRESEDANRTDSALDDVNMLDTSFYSGTALSKSVVEQASNVASTYGNIDPLPLSRPNYSRPLNHNSTTTTTTATTATTKRRAKSPPKPRKPRDMSKPKVYLCELCNKTFAGASGLWYHNKHVHGAETQLRPRKNKKKKQAAAAAAAVAAAANNTFGF